MRRWRTRWPVVLWVAGGLALLVVAVLVILPPLLSADYHRAAIEALASRLTGRQVIIKGPIRLAMVPVPQLNAGDIRIDVPHGERISAASLRLDLAPRALLLGRLRATRLTLHAPRIVVPWPLPRGAASILPPPWLASLHAKIEDGTIILGMLVFHHADLSIFTGGSKAVLAASGTGTIFGTPVTANFNLAGVNSHGLSPIAASIATPVSNLIPQKAGLSFSGTVNAKSRLAGTLAGSAVAAMVRSLPLGHALPAAPLQFTAQARASRRMVMLSVIKLNAGAASLQGNASIDLTTGMSSLMVHGQGIDVTPVFRLFNQGWPGVIRLHADMTKTRLSDFTFASLRTDLRAAPSGTIISAFSATLPGQGRLSLSGRLGVSGLHGRFSLADAMPAALIRANASALPLLASLPPPAGPLHLAGAVDIRKAAGGRRLRIRLDGLHGTVGGTSTGGATLASGAVVARLSPAQLSQAKLSQAKLAHAAGAARRSSIAVSLAFDRLDATPLLRFIRTPPAKAGAARLDLSLTARQARIGTIEARRLLFDARLGKALNLRAFDFYTKAHRRGPAALVALRGRRSASGLISHAKLHVAAPDAAHLATLLPPSRAVSALIRSGMGAGTPFAASLSASGPFNALAARVVADLGTIRLRAAPRIDLANRTASGPLTFRMPDAIALVKPWDSRAGLAWPGAGSASLRADFAAAPRHFSLTNFVLSFGALTTAGRLTLDYGSKPYTLSGVLNADRLALPPAGRLLGLAMLPDRPALQLATISAAHILAGGVDIADDATLRLAAPPHAVTLTVSHANVARGTLAGQASVIEPGAIAPSAAAPGAAAPGAAAPPRLKADLNLTDADAAALQGAFAAAGLPPVLAAGHLTIGWNTEASGYSGKTWAATLGGSMTASGSDLTVRGLDLAAAAKALSGAQAPDAAALRRVLLAGTTNFTTMTLDGGFANGAFTIGKGQLDGAAGSVSLAGSADLPDRSLAITATLQPKPAGTTAPQKFKIALSGPWAKPKRIVDTATVPP